jgi:hypothetical protein
MELKLDVHKVLDRDFPDYSFRLEADDCALGYSSSEVPSFTLTAHVIQFS